MRRSLIRGCCPICDRYEGYMKASRDGARKHRKMNKAVNRKLRRVMADRLRHGDYEPVFMSYERWF